MKAYITEHALTRGIEEVEGELDRIYGLELYDGVHWHHNSYWHRTREAAVARAEELRDAEITKLEARVAELKAMTFGEER